MSPNLLFIIVLAFFCLQNLHAQNQANNWYFGDGAGLNFNTEEATPLLNGSITVTSAYGENEGTSVISDNEGNLLFYSDGQRVWNRAHNIMPNADGLLGHNSSTHAAFIVPLPLSNRYYYLFTTDSWIHNDLKNGLRYSVVDICLNDGLGDIIPEQKNILLQELMAEKIAVARHSNGVDYWIVTHKYLSDAFYAYRLTPEGLDVNNPVITKIGRVHEVLPGNAATGAAIGQMKISSNGEKLALCVGNSTPFVELFSFDANTGVLSNSIDFAGVITKQMYSSYDIYGVEFSPDNKKLYFSFYDKVFQADLSAENGGADDIFNSIMQIGSFNSENGFYGMQLAPNGKIYVSNYNDIVVSTIENPNAAGAACNFRYGAQQLGGRKVSYSFPSFIAGFDYKNTNNVNCVPDCSGEIGGDKIFDICGACLLPEDPTFDKSCEDCTGIPNGDFVEDECGNCLMPDNPLFNQCLDCKNTPYGNYVEDECGNCLLPDDMVFNECVDCKNTPFGDYVEDECGECLLPDDPLFNQCVDCNNVPFGNYVIDDCGNCLSPNDPLINLCLDCQGTPGGNYIEDECGNCLSPNDAAFNQSCADCTGIPNGNFVVDLCGECLLPNDTAFNQSCADCTGAPNGNFVVDECGECLPPNDPLFNISCLEAKIFIPNAFTPNTDGVNDLFKVYSNNTWPVQIKTYVIYNRFAQKLYVAQNFNITDNSFWWDGRFENEAQPLGVYNYYIEAEILNEPIQKFKGNVTLVR